MKFVPWMLLVAASLLVVNLDVASAATPVIMPLGDSITDGYIPDAGSYRTQLYTDLTNAGIQFNYVGSQTDNPSTTLTSAAASNSTLVQHEGHSGYRVDQIANNLTGVDSSGSANTSNGGFWLTGGNGTGRAAAQPSIVLLMIGTNDVTQGFSLAGNYTKADGTTASSTVGALETRLVGLVNQLVTARPNAEIFVASLPAINDNFNVGSPTSFNPLVLAYNTLIQTALVPRAQALGEKVYFVDQYANFVNGDGSVKTSLYGDFEHPNTAGGNAMGNTWFNAIQSVPEPDSVVLAVLGAGIAFGVHRLKRAGRSRTKAFSEGV